MNKHHPCSFALHSALAGSSSSPTNGRVASKLWKTKTRSGITTDPGGHPPHRPYAQPEGRTRAKQDQAQASAPGQNQTRSVGGATTHGRRTVGRRKRANIDAVGGWQVHTADYTPSRNAATRSKHCNFMSQGDIWPRVAAGSSRNGTTQAVAATTGT